MEKILVYGGAGFCGSVLLGKLLNRGYKVICADNLYKGYHGIMQYTLFENFKFIKCDITDIEDVRKTLKDKPDAIIIMSGIVGLDACDNNKKLAIEVNDIGWKNIVDESYDIPKIACSTGSVYGKIIGNICSEDTEINPQSLYGTTKYAGEKHILQAKGIALRFATAVGMSPLHRLKLLPNELCYKAYTDKILNIFEPNALRTFVDIRDFCDALIYFMENYDNVPYGAYNIGREDNNWTKKKLAEYICDRVGSKVVFNETNKDKDCRDYFCSYDKARSYGFECQYKLEDTLNLMIQQMPLIVEKYQIYH